MKENFGAFLKKRGGKKKKASGRLNNKKTDSIQELPF